LVACRLFAYFFADPKKYVGKQAAGVRRNNFRQSIYEPISTSLHPLQLKDSAYLSCSFEMGSEAFLNRGLNSFLLVVLLYQLKKPLGGLF